MRWFALVALCASATSARAERDTFVSLDRGDKATRVGIESSLSTTAYASDPVSRTTVWRSELYGQYVHASGLGGYAKLPLSYAYHQYDEDDGGTGSLRTHNAELGALYAAKLGAASGVVAQLGLALPTLNDDLLFRYRLAFDGSRAGDALLSIASRVTALRLSASPTVRSGRVYARADVGVDVVLTAKDTEGGNHLPTVMVRGGLGGGFFATPAVAVTAELAMYNLGRDGSLRTLALAGRMQLGTFAPYAAIILPIDRREVGPTVTLGVEARP